MEPGHRQIDHTADVALEVWAPDEPALLLEAARAVVSLLTEEGRVAGAARRTVCVAALDPEDRLVRWLNEVIVLAVTEGFLVSDATLRLRPDGLDADLQGEADAFARVRTELKSATYHDLQLHRRADGWRAQIVLDV